MYRMSRKTSLYLNPQLEQLAEAKGEPLPETLHRGLSVTPVLIEENEQGGFITHWYCAVPDEGVRFRVLRDHWLNRTPPVREVYEVQVSRP
jgi:hypothetical protein